VLFEAAIHGCGFTVPEVLNYHEQGPAGPPATLLMTATWTRPNDQVNRRPAPLRAKKKTRTRASG
jgi:hypothetical protein